MPARRLEKINKEIQRMVGTILQRDADIPPGVLMTVSRVETTAHMRSATIWLSILPEDEQEAVLEQLKPQMYDIQGVFNRAIKMHPIPRLRLEIDHGAEQADKVHQRLDDIK